MTSKTGKQSTRLSHLATWPLSHPIVVTIDGPGGVGKSTVAKTLAQSLEIMYLDTGATYRALAFAALEKHWVSNVERLAHLAKHLPLRLKPLPGGGLRVLLDGRDITRAIRTERISEAAAQVSQYPQVREAMVNLQRRLASQHSVVVEGRDTGSVVFPHAAYKFFLDANPAIRARRRQKELTQLYGTKASLKLVEEQLQFRDELDRSRKTGPLVKPDGAVVIDTSRLTIGQVVKRMLGHIHTHCNGKAQKP